MDVAYAAKQESPADGDILLRLHSQHLPWDHCQATVENAIGDHQQQYSNDAIDLFVLGSRKFLQFCGRAGLYAMLC